MNKSLKKQKSLLENIPSDGKEKKISVVIVNQHGNNRGDEAALRGMLYGLSKLISGAKFTVFTITPAKDFHHISGADFFDTDVLVRNNIGRLFYFSIAILLYRLKFRKLSKILGKQSHFLESLKRADIVLSAPGGPYFGDIYRGLEPTCALPIYIAKLLGKPIMIYGPSQGPFENKFRNKWRKWLLSRVDCIAVREQYSKVYLENLGIKSSSVYVTADSCLQKPIDPLLQEEVIKKEHVKTSKMLIGVVPLHKLPSATSSESEFLDIKKMAAKTISLLGEFFDAEFILIPQLYGSYSDTSEMAQIAFSTGIQDRIKILPESYNSDQQQSLIGVCDILLSFRYHPFIFASRQAVPCVCVAYEHKAFGFANAMGLQKYCLDLFSMTPEDIVEVVKERWASKADITEHVASKIGELEDLSFNNSKLAAGVLFRFRKAKCLN